MSVVLTESELLIDGRPVRLLSGALHYFRTLPEQWRDRLQSAVDLGLNCVETYVQWDLHEPKPGAYTFEGRADLGRFLREAQELGLYVIVRPGPYVCAEIDNGGLPPWLLPKCPGRFRRMNDVYLAEVRKWFSVLLPYLGEFLWTRGGPIVLTVAENEYGSFGRDKEYLAFMKQLFLDNGFDIPILTADGGGENNYLLGGNLRGTPVSLTLGAPDAKHCFPNQDKLLPGLPHLCLEYWNGPIIHWGEKIPRIDQAATLEGLDHLLASGAAAVNLYMFQGGTNFGFHSGANASWPGANDYAPDVTSYDYRAPVSEWGDPAPTFPKYQEILAKYNPNARLAQRPLRPKLPAKNVPFTHFAPLLAHLGELSRPMKMTETEPMESWGQTHGFALYECTLYGPCGNCGALPLHLQEMHDRAQVWLDGEFLGTLWRNEPLKAFPLVLGEGEHRLQMLVEDCGHINYGPLFGSDLKGILGGVTLMYQYQKDYTVWPLPLEDLSGLTWEGQAPAPNVPCFARGLFDISGEVADCFLKFPGAHGNVWLNGFHLGRYRNCGPGDRLYVPWPLLRQGQNEIIVLEMDRLDATAEFTPEPPHYQY